jgi:predicted Zn-dependent protease
MGFPAGWTQQDSRSSVVAGEPNQHAAMQLTLAPATSGSPGGYVDELQRTGKISGAAGRSETIGGYPAWVGHVTVPGQNGASTTLVAGFVRQTSERMFQLLGKSTALGDADEQAILQSLRSFRGLNDPARLHPTPDRIDVAVVPTSTTFEAAVQSLEPKTRDVEEVAILNNAFVDQPARKGERIKLVRPGRVR